MAVQVQNDISPKEIAGYAAETSQQPTHKWYFSGEEIEFQSPSRSDGIDYKQEENLRKLFCSFLQELGMELKVPQVTIATAIMFCHRFYMRQSHAKNDWQTMATVCMFLACKAEETPRWLGELAVVAYKLIYKGDPSASRRIREIYDKQKELILIGERLLLYVLAFDLNIEHPYKSLVAALKRLGITHKDLVKFAWNFVNDWLHTSLCLQHKPHYIAAGSLFLAAKFTKEKLPTSKEKTWWMEFDVSPKQLEDVIQQMMRLWEHSQSQSKRQSQTVTLKDQKVTESPIRKASTTTSNCEKKVAFGKAHDTSREIKNRQTSDMGSGVSVVEDGDIGETVTVNCEKKVAFGKAHDTSREIKNRQTSDMGSGVSVVEDGDIGEPVTVNCEKKVAFGKAHDTSREIKNRQTIDMGSGVSVVEDGDIGEPVTVNCEKKVAFGKAHDTSREIKNCQTSDMGSGVSVVEDSDIGQPVTVKSDLSSSSKTVSVGVNSAIVSVVEDGDIGEPVTIKSDLSSSSMTASVGVNSAIVDVNKIREKLKKRNLIKSMKRKRVEEGMDDETDWIEREIEDGIVLQSTYPEKQRKI